MKANYLHICDKSEKCKCGWTGCFCESKHSSKKISDTKTENYQHCPKCKKIISTGSMTIINSGSQAMLEYKNGYMIYCTEDIFPPKDILKKLNKIKKKKKNK
jgi:hypothetical protein